MVGTLRAVQDHRTKAWWEEQQPFCEASDRSQTFESWRHRQRGRQKQPWEAPVVKALGPNWRVQCENATAAEWKATTKEAINLLCEAWHLPNIPEKKKATPERRARGRPKSKGKAKGKSHPRQVPTNQKRAEIPTQEEWQTYLRHPPWKTPEGSYRHLVDAQLVANWLNGKTKCLEAWADQHAEPIFETAIKLREHWKPAPRQRICDWVPRERNLEADWACNAALEG